MEITIELLAAYAEGKVSDAERNAVRQYLANHPAQLETVMTMMDEDYDIALQDEIEDTSATNSVCPKDSFADICYSAAAFAPRITPLKTHVESPRHADKKTFNQHLDELLDDIPL